MIYNYQIGMTFYIGALENTVQEAWGCERAANDFPPTPELTNNAGNL
jgi:hypothetical protein